MKYVPFDLSMIGQHEIIIWCPECELQEQLADDLDSVGVFWRGGKMRFTDPSIRWGGDTFVRITEERFAAKANKSYYEREPEYRECSFTVYNGRNIIDVGDLI